MKLATLIERATRIVVCVAFVSLVPRCMAVSAPVDDEKKSDGGAEKEKEKDAGSVSDAAWVCTAKTCEDLSANCGQASNGCGVLIDCGTCPSGEICGGAGPNRCGTGPCTPATCATAGADCGQIGDDCGAALDCGKCTAPLVCGANGQPNHCGCVPTTCAAASASCGSISDQCGGTLNCGSCTAPKTCGGLGTPNVCDCSPQACPPIYQNSFESDADFPTGWTVWHNCAVDDTWEIARKGYFAPNGGQSNLRFHTTGFTANCQFPGGYALSPKISALPGRSYRVELWSRNAANVGNTLLMFFDASDKQLDVSSVVWTPDAWAYSADPALTAKSPTGTVALRIRLELHSPSQTADVDLLAVYLEPP